jgi:Tfp pilus assembly PilM family ATPase
LAKEKEISSTSKLLDLIRKDDKEKAGPPVSSNTGEKKKSPFLSLLSKSFKKLSFSRKDIVGVDFSDRFLNLVRLVDSPHGWKLINARSIPIPWDLKTGTLKFSSFLQRCLSDFTNKDSGISIWTHISSSKTEIWTVRAPAVKKNQGQAVYWTAKKEKPFSEKEYLFDYRIVDETIESGVKKIIANAFIVPHSEVKWAKEIFSRAGYHLEGITVSTFAFQNLLYHKIVDPGDKPFAILYMAHDFSRIDIHQGKVLMLSRVIKTGTDSMAESILYESGSLIEKSLSDMENDLKNGKSMIEENKNLQKGYELLNSLIKEKKAVTDDRDFSTIAPVFERLARQIDRTFDHFVNVQGHKPVEKVFLTGFPAAMSGLDVFFTDQLGIAAETIDPMLLSQSLYSSTLSLGRTERLSLAPAMALTLSDNSHTPNFLHTSKDRLEQNIAEKLNLAAAAGCMLLVLSAGIYLWHATSGVNQMLNEKAVLQKKIQAFEPGVTRSIVTEMSVEFQKEQQHLRQLSRKQAGIAIMNEFSAQIPENISILHLRVDMDRDANDFSPLKGVVVLEGIVKGDHGIQETALSSLLLRLRESPLFSQASIHRSSKEDFPAEGEVLRFVINLSLGKV